MILLISLGLYLSTHNNDSAGRSATKIKYIIAQQKEKQQKYFGYMEAVLLDKTLRGEGSYRPNWLRFVLPYSSPATTLLVSFSITLLFVFMTQLCMARNMSEKSNDVLSRDCSHELKWVKTNLSRCCLFQAVKKRRKFLTKQMFQPLKISYHKLHDNILENMPKIFCQTVTDFFLKQFMAALHEIFRALLHNDY